MNTRKKSLPPQLNGVAVKRTRDRLLAQLKALYVIGTYVDPPTVLGQWERLMLRGNALGGKEMALPLLVRVLNGEVHLNMGKGTYQIIPVRRNLGGRKAVAHLIDLALGRTDKSWTEHKYLTDKARQDKEAARLAEVARVNEVMRQGNRLLEAAMITAGYPARSPEVLVHSDAQGMAPYLTLVGPWTPDQVQEILMAVRKIRDRG